MIEQLLTPVMLSALLIYFAAGVVKGTLGIGFPTTAVSLLAQVTDTRTAIALVIIPMAVTNAWQVWRNRRVRWVFRQFGILLFFMMLFIGIFSQVAGAVPLAFLTAALGGIVSVYAATGLFRPIFFIPQRYDRPAQTIAGVTSGVMGGLTGVWAPPLLIYLSSRGLDKDEFVATSGVLLFLGTLVLFSGYVRTGMLEGPTMIMSCLLLVPSMAGFSVGELIRRRLSAKRFERILLWFFLLMGLNLIRRAVL